MARATSRFVCQACGAVHPRWAGRCEACGAWNSIDEEAAAAATGGSRGRRAKGLDFVGLTGTTAPPPRLQTGMPEFDRVTGGGLVEGSALLVGGDPGIGKSTLLLQVLARLAPQARVAYVSGEEAIEQIRLRARRLGVAEAPVALAAATDMGSVLASLDGAEPPRVVVIDSIQTMHIAQLDSAPGTVSQVRACAAELIRVAKRRGIVVVIVGHVTKEGLIAGPRVLEHMVDTVLYFEGERGHSFRILRAVKNRFGATDEIGVFEMTDRGLAEVSNPSALFLGERGEPASGAAVFCGIEGTRPVLVEIQALVAASPFSTPRRAVVGWDTGRLAMVTAVLEARCGVVLAGQDVYLNVAGGLRVSEPAADLAVAAALVSAAVDQPLPRGTVVFGEIGLAGDVRPVGHAGARLKEAAKLGFERAIIPARRGAAEAEGALERVEVKWLSDLVASVEGTAGRDRRAGRGSTGSGRSR